MSIELSPFQQRKLLAVIANYRVHFLSNTDDGSVHRECYLNKVTAQERADFLRRRYEAGLSQFGWFERMGGSSGFYELLTGHATQFYRELTQAAPTQTPSHPTVLPFSQFNQGFFSATGLVQQSSMPFPVLGQSVPQRTVDVQSGLDVFSRLATPPQPVSFMGGKSHVQTSMEDRWRRGGWEENEDVEYFFRDNLYPLYVPAPGFVNYVPGVSQESILAERERFALLDDLDKVNHLRSFVEDKIGEAESTCHPETIDLCGSGISNFIDWNIYKLMLALDPTLQDRVDLVFGN